MLRRARPTSVCVSSTSGNTASTWRGRSAVHERHINAGDPFAFGSADEPFGIAPGIDAKLEPVLARQAVHDVGQVSFDA